jgi:IS30 family transposase
VTASDPKHKPLKYRERMRKALEQMPKWISPQVVAESLGVDRATVHRMVKRGTLEGENIDGPGSPIRILADDYARYVEALQQKSEDRKLRRRKAG